MTTGLYLVGNDAKPSDPPDADHFHVFAVQDWGGSQEFLRGFDERLSYADAVQLVTDMAEADTAYTGHHMAGTTSAEDYEAVQRKFGDRFDDLISGNVCPGWDGIWIIPCVPDCAFQELFDMPAHEWSGDPHWTPGTNSQ